MEDNIRRNFIKSLATGIAGTIALPSLAFSAVEKKNHTWLKSRDSSAEEFWVTVKEQFEFAPGLRYFNNGSLGSSPISVQKATKEYIETLDGFPSKYMWGGWKDAKEEVRKNIANLFSVSEEEIALIHNTTEGMNLIARSFDLQPGDEVILADHEHSSGTIPWEVWQETKGVKLVRPTLPILPKTVDELVSVYEKAITPNTKIISMCHIVNTNGMILPVKEVSKMAHEKDILVAVDGAQSAGMFDINLHDLGCDFYAASSHKWLFSPKGVGILYAKESSQHYLQPLMVARGHTDKSIRRLENYNTRNLPEVLGLGSAINFIDDIGIERIQNRSYELKAYFRSKIASNPKFKLKTPELDELSASIQVVEIVDKDVVEMKKQLFDEFGIDCRPMRGFNLNALRISLSIYITKKDIDYLVEALVKIA
ncbi:MAG: aminotransferase class V-fold PLP-dependent enzyme [Bacteroidetes bacterium]|nr:MAG: aminotransferase class V-fold PLP-dependent enzyme [Bacteroidota bacterium]